MLFAFFSLPICTHFDNTDNFKDSLYPGTVCIISINVVNPVAWVVALIGSNTWSNEGNTVQKNNRDLYQCHQ